MSLLPVRLAYIPTPSSDQVSSEQKLKGKYDICSGETNSLEQSPSQDAVRESRRSPLFMKTEGSLPCSYEFALVCILNQMNLAPILIIYSLKRFILILLFRLLLGLTSSSLSSGFRPTFCTYFPFLPCVLHSPPISPSLFPSLYLGAQCKL